MKKSYYVCQIGEPQNLGCSNRRYETIVSADIIKPDNLSVALMKATTEMPVLLIMKCIVNGNHIIVSVPIANSNNCRVTLKKGVKMVLKVTSIEENTVHSFTLNSQQEISEELIANLRKSCGNLSEEELFKATDFLSSTPLCKGK